MQQIVGNAQANAIHSWIIPVVASLENRLELISFFTKIAASHRRSDYYRVLNGKLPKTHELERDESTSLLIVKGEELPLSHQQLIVDYRLANFPVVIAAVQPGSSQVTHGTGWIKEFHDACAPLPLSWPTWAEREADHATIISLIRSRLSMPDGSSVPDFDDKVMEYLLASPFEGTITVERDIKSALKRYIQQRSTGPLTIQHFTAFRHAHILLNRKNVPPISLVR
ncbi:hypothetical protein HZC53_04640 [Candidatus Uhrbacteria bacterium]|nr:hypothetical protein [Candidatus Uhrbacteria bacterium]